MDFDSFQSISTSGKAFQGNTRPARPARPEPSTQTLPKIIHNPETGITYYLDEYAGKYYYVDPQTKQTVYYSS